MTRTELADAVRGRPDLIVIDEVGDTLTVARPHDAAYRYRHQVLTITDDGPRWTWRLRRHGTEDAEDAALTWVQGPRIDGATTYEVAATVAELLCLTQPSAFAPVSLACMGLVRGYPQPKISVARMPPIRVTTDVREVTVVVTYARRGADGANVLA